MRRELRLKEQCCDGTFLLLKSGELGIFCHCEECWQMSTRLGPGDLPGCPHSPGGFWWVSHGRTLL